MNVYETIVILDESLTDEAIDEALQKVKDLISAQGGEVLKTDPWGRRKLGYEINKRTRGFYALILHKSPPGTVKVLEDHFKVTDGIFKYMVVKLEKKQRDAALKALVEAAAPAPAEAAAPEAETPTEPAPEAPAE